jgi:chaperonin GroES
MDEIESTRENPLEEMIESINLAEKLSDDELLQIGNEAKRGYEADLDSREKWEKSLEEWTRLAKLTLENKTYPWPNASNVKYPLLATAALQFHARAYPSLLPSDGRIVKAKPIGKDPTGEKSKVAEAVSIYMSYQLMEEMDGWEEGMDKLLIMLPILGVMFKKTYWDPIKKINCSKLIHPKDLVVDYWATSLAEAERISEVLEFNPRQVKEKQQSGLWLDTDLPEPSMHDQVRRTTEDTPSQIDETTPSIFVEQHRYLDLDDDDYKEPYIVTFHAATGKVLRIVARYDTSTTYFTDDGKLSRIEPIQYYTKYGFIPNPDGSFYDMGFGVLLGPINESVNTLINQLIDAGTLNNMQAGFIGKGLRLRMGETRFTPGEWKVVNSTGDDLRKQIVEMPSKEPSKVLFDLMQALIQSGKELASVAEIFTGKMPGQNTPATTTMASIEQGMKVFTAVYKRIYRAMGEEFYKLFRLNGIYLNPHTYVDIVDMDVGPEDFSKDAHSIRPGADPNAVSQTEKLLKAQGLMELLPSGLLNPVEVIKRMLIAQEQPNWEQLVPPQVLESGQPPPPPPDPKMQEMQMKGQLEQQKIQMQGQAQQQKMYLEAQGAKTKLAMQAEQHAMEMQHKAELNQVQLAEAEHKQKIFSAQANAEAIQNLQHSEMQHRQAMHQGEEKHRASVEQTKAQAKAKPSNKGAKPK